nr:DUF3102 domain-containing protein [Desulfosporosinus fructosivorans]
MRMISNRTPEQIASENVIKEESGKMLLPNAVEIGRRLTEAKELVPHGEWLNWLTESVSYTRSTASRLMKTFREYGSILSSPDEREPKWCIDAPFEPLYSPPLTRKRAQMVHRCTI